MPNAVPQQEIKNDTGDPVPVKDLGGTDLTPIGNVSDAKKVHVVNSFAAGTADKTTYTYGTSISNAIAGVYQDTSPDLTAGQQGGLRATSKRALHTHLRDESGVAFGTSTNPIFVVTEESALARLGKSFFVSTNGVSTGVNTEAAYLLLKNASGNTKSARIGRICFSAPSSGSTAYKIYLNPTITLNGTAITVVGARQSGQAAVQLTPFRAPTVSANGTVFKAFNVPTGSNFILELDFGIWLEPNNSILITSQQSLIGGYSGVDVEFSEE